MAAFQQDNVPYGEAQISLNWFLKYNGEFTVLKGYS